MSDCNIKKSLIVHYVHGHERGTTGAQSKFHELKTH